MAKLTATFVKSNAKPGRYGDGNGNGNGNGNGLFLLVGRSGRKSWMVRVQKEGRRRDKGLGSAAKVSLKLARERAAIARSQAEAGIDPVAGRRKVAGIPTFREAAALVHAEHKSGWKNGQHQKQWLSTLEVYTFPAFGDLAVSLIDTAAVRDPLVPIWLRKPETARRLRQRIRTVVDWAVAKVLPRARAGHDGDRQGASQAACQGEASRRAPLPRFPHSSPNCASARWDASLSKP